MTRRFYPPTQSDFHPHGGVDSNVYADVHRERIRAHAKHDARGGSMERKDFDDPAWLPVLLEEVGEVARALCEHHLGNLDRDALGDKLRAELIQVCAMAAAWVDAIILDEEPLEPEPLDP